MSRGGEAVQSGEEISGFQAIIEPLANIEGFNEAPIELMEVWRFKGRNRAEKKIKTSASHFSFLAMRLAFR